MTSELKQTPFSTSYPDGVVEWIDVFGFAVPLTWGDPDAEYAAVRNDAAAMEFSMLLKWDVTGPAAIKTVNSIFSRNISNMQAGQIAYGVVTTSEGKMVDDCTVFVHGPEHVRIFGGNQAVEEILDNHRPANVKVKQRREDFAQLSVQGPKSRTILQKLTSTSLANDALPYYRFLEDIDMSGITVQVSRLGFTGELGYEILLPANQADSFWNALFQAGETDGLVAAGAAAVMMCRIESGMIMAELEYDHTMTPFECRMGWAVDLSKPEFQGKSALETAEASAKIDVCSLIFSQQDDYDGATLLIDNEPVGHVTMAIPSPYLEGKFLCLARLCRRHSKPGTVLQVKQGKTATVVAMPVYDPKRIRVRS